MTLFRFFQSCLFTAVVLTSLSSWANDSQDFSFFFQGIFSDKVTLERVKTIFHDFSSNINQPVNFSGGPTIEDIEQAIDDNPFDLLLWGYSDEVNRHLVRHGYKQLVSSLLTINMYQFNDNPIPKNSPNKIAVLRHSAAHYSVKHFFSEQSDTMNISTFDNYFLIVEACFRKEINTVIGAKPFLTLQPGAVKKRFSFVKSLPEHARIAIWVKSDMSNILKENITQYFIDREVKFSQIFGSKKFKIIN
ncbi:hypothetical protein ACU6U9_23610 [Pseudomonas sp. HK3]